MLFRTRDLRLSLIKYQEELNRNWNREICKNFDEMAGKLGEIPDDTKVFIILVLLLKAKNKNFDIFIYNIKIYKRYGNKVQN